MTLVELNDFYEIFETESVLLLKKFLLKIVLQQCLVLDTLANFQLR